MNNGQNVARSRHLEELARAAKRYTLQEIFNVTEAVATELGGLSLANHNDFTGATSITGGLSGLVPAPQAGDESKFLRGDGSWSTVESGGASYAEATTVSSGLMSAADKVKLDNLSNYTLPTASTTTKGGVKIGSGLQMSGDTLSVDSSALTAGTVLDTVPATVDGGLCYEKTGSVPALWLRKDNYEYSFVYSGLRYLASNEYLKCYLPFDASTTADACGNFWSIVGAPFIDSRIKKFGHGSICLRQNTYIYTQTEFSVNNPTWTFDFWAFCTNKPTPLFQFGADKREGARAGFYVDSSNIELLGANGSWIIDKNITDSLTPLAVKWSHFAATRKNDVFRFFIDGQIIAEVQLTQSIQTTGNYLTLGASYGNIAANICGELYLDSVRLFNGVALWTSDFTPPTAADY